MTRGVPVAALMALGAVLALAPAGALSGQDASLATTAEPDQVTVGGRVFLTVTVEHGAEQQVHFPDSLSLAPFEVLDRSVSLPGAADGGRLRSVARYTLTAFELGELEVPSFEVAVVGPGEAAATLDTSPWGVEVVSVGRDEGGDIRDVKAPLDIPIGGLILLAGLLGLILLAAVMYWLYRKHRGQPAAEAILVNAPLRRPYEVAYDELHALERSGLLEAGRIKDYYVRVSEIIRAYLEAQFGVPALEMASFEVVDGLAALGLDPASLRSVEGFLAECDLVKFAKFRPDAGRAQEIVPRARRLVDRTKVGRPRPVAVAAAAATTADPAAGAATDEAGIPISAPGKEPRRDAVREGPVDPGAPTQEGPEARTSEPSADSGSSRDNPSGPTLGPPSPEDAP